MYIALIVERDTLTLLEVSGRGFRDGAVTTDFLLQNTCFVALCLGILAFLCTEIF